MDDIYTSRPALGATSSLRGGAQMPPTFAMLGGRRFTLGVMGTTPRMQVDQGSPSWLWSLLIFDLIPVEI